MSRKRSIRLHFCHLACFKFLHLADIYENRTYENSVANHSLSISEPNKSFSPREDNVFSSRREMSTLAKIKLYLREDNFLYVVTTEKNILSTTSVRHCISPLQGDTKPATRQKCNCIGGSRGGRREYSRTDVSDNGGTRLDDRRGMLGGGCLRVSASNLQPSLVGITVIAVVGEDDVVAQCEIEQAGGLLHLTGEAVVMLARAQVA